MKNNSLFILILLTASSAHAELPLFAAKCGASLNVDTNPKGQIYMNGKVAKTTKHADGQISAHAVGAWVDITPNGSEQPKVTYTAKDKSTGVCQILSFASSSTPAVTPKNSNRASHSERAGLGQFDARGDISCAEGKGQPMHQCAFEVARDPGGNASVKVSLPSGKSRFIFFENGKALGADLSQADGDMTFKATKQGDTYKIQAGHEEYEIIEAVVFGG